MTQPGYETPERRAQLYDGYAAGDDDDLAEAWVCPQPTCRFRTEGMSLADHDAYARHQAWHRDRMLPAD